MLTNLIGAKAKKLRALNTIELLTVVGMVAVIFTGGFQVFRQAIIVQGRIKDYIKAEFLARDLIELTISKRNEDWNSLVPGQYYFVEDVDEGFLFTAGTETIDSYTRSVTISEVERDGNGNIVSSGGTVDADIYRAVAVVDWTYRSRNFNVTLTQYLSNWRRF